MAKIIFIFFISTVWFFVSRICFIGIENLGKNNDLGKSNLFQSFIIFSKYLGYYFLAFLISLSLTAGIFITNNVSLVFDDGEVMNNSNNLHIYTESVVD